MSGSWWPHFLCDRLLRTETSCSPQLQQNVRIFSEVRLIELIIVAVNNSSLYFLALFEGQMCGHLGLCLQVYLTALSLDPALVSAKQRYYLPYLYSHAPQLGVPSRSSCQNFCHFGHLQWIDHLCQSWCLFLPLFTLLWCSQVSGMSGLPNNSPRRSPDFHHSCLRYYFSSGQYLVNLIYRQHYLNFEFSNFCLIHRSPFGDNPYP